MHRDESTGSIVRKAQEGDAAAFDVLVRRHRELLGERVRRRMGPRVRGRLEVDDVLQETFARAFDSICRFRWKGQGSFDRWLASIAENLILNASQKKDQVVLRLDNDVPARDVSPSKALRQHERFDRLENALNGLSADHRDVLVMARIDRLKVREIARKMNRSPEAVQKLLARAILALKRSFGDTESLQLPDRDLQVDERGDDE